MKPVKLETETEKILFILFCQARSRHLFVSMQGKFL